MMTYKVRKILPDDEHGLVHLVITQMFYVRQRRVIGKQLTRYNFWWATTTIGGILSYNTEDVILGVFTAVLFGISTIYVTIKCVFYFRRHISFPDVYVHNFYQYWSCVGERELYVAELDREPVGCCGYVRLNDATDWWLTGRWQGKA